MKIGWELWLLSSSVLAGLILLVVILAIKKSKTQTVASWKTPFVFLWANLLRPWKLIGWLLAVGAGYGIYLIVISNLSTLEEKTFKELSKNLAEVELQPEKDKLSVLNAKVKKGGILTEEEKMVAMNATKKIGKVRKNYSEGKLVAPKQSEELPTEKTEWRILFTSSDKIMKREKNQQNLFDLKVLSLLESTDKKTLTLSYISTTGDKKTVELTRGKEAEYYKGWFENTHPDKKRDNIKFYLLEDKTPWYENTDGVTGKKSKIFPAFFGNVGENEMTVKIFKRVSSS